MTERLVVIRADANWSIGGGHVMRCLSLADGLRGAGWCCAFAGSAETLDTVPSLGESGHEIFTLPDGASEPGRLQAQWPAGVDLLVVDHYQRDVDFESACRPWARRILAVDDLADRTHDADFLLDQTLGRVPEAYEPLVSSSCRLFLGPEYALLRDQFASARSVALAHRASSEAVRRIQVSMGATDPDNITTTVLKGIAASAVRAQIDVLVSGASPHLPVVQSTAAAMEQDVSVHTWVSDMAAMLIDTDLVIGAGGSSSWERCCLAVPALLVTTAENQRLIAEHLHEAGAVRWLGHGRAVEPSLVAAAVGEIAADRSVWRLMSETTSRICDGRGVARVVAAMGS